jgi:hypothetical protein
MNATVGGKKRPNSKFWPGAGVSLLLVKNQLTNCPLLLTKKKQ